MSGSREGAIKAAQTARERHGKDFHAKAASKSWNNPNRSRKVGFAIMDPDTHKNVSAKGGRSTKDEEDSTTPGDSDS